jgi:hypothetical protein
MSLVHMSLLFLEQLLPAPAVDVVDKAVSGLPTIREHSLASDRKSRTGNTAIIVIQIVQKR